jgi:hypothetical protein
MNEQTPVYQEPWHGWRAWHVRLGDGAPRLQDLWKASHEWPARERAEASCRRTKPWRPWRRNAPAHALAQVPRLDCTCGFVALPDPAGAVEYLEDWEEFITRQSRYRRRHLLIERYGHARPLPAFGRVDLWGDAIEHGPLLDGAQITGVRTRYAYPQELWLPTHWWHQRSEVDMASVADQLAEAYGIPVHPIIDLADIVTVWRATSNLQA